MADGARGRGRGRANRGSGDARARRPGEQAGSSGPQQPGPRPQPPATWAAPTAAPSQRPGMPTQPQGRGIRKPPTTHEHPGDVDIQTQLKSISLGKIFQFSHCLSSLASESCIIVCGKKIMISKLAPSGCIWKINTLK